jgi:hypothetical protein
MKLKAEGRALLFVDFPTLCGSGDPFGKLGNSSSVPRWQTVMLRLPFTISWATFAELFLSSWGWREDSKERQGSFSALPWDLQSVAEWEAGITLGKCGLHCNLP